MKIHIFLNVSIKFYLQIQGWRQKRVCEDELGKGFPSHHKWSRAALRRCPHPARRLNRTSQRVMFMLIIRRVFAIYIDVKITLDVRYSNLVHLVHSCNGQ